MSSSVALKEVFTAARPLVEQWLDVAEQIAALRDVATAKGLDWSQLKALLKAQIQDERDETGAGKRVQRIVEKAEFASAYADMLGLAKMNENNFSAGDDEAEQFPRPASSAVSGGEPGIPSSDDGGAKIVEVTASHGRAAQAGGKDAQSERAATVSNPAIALLPDAAGQTGDAASPPAASPVAQTEPYEPPVFLVKPVVLRPHCQRPENCGGYGRTHCGSCERASRAKEAA